VYLAQASSLLEKICHRLNNTVIAKRYKMLLWEHLPQALERNHE
jgi:hypothetical protein